MKQIYSIVYNFTFEEAIQTYLPAPIICRNATDGTPLYWEALAVNENIESYGLNVSESPHAELLKICQELSLNSIEQYYNRNKKKAVSLFSLFEDKTVSKTIQQAIDRKKALFFDVVSVAKNIQVDVLITHNLVRKVRVSEVRLEYSDSLIVPIVSFSKTQTGIKYVMALNNGGQTILPSDHNILLLTNIPGYIALDSIIFKLDTISTNKLQPFLKKKEVFIPAKLTVDYFEKFISEIIQKVEYQAEGFEVVEESDLLQAKISFIHQLFDQRWMISLSFIYSNWEVNSKDKRLAKSIIKYHDAGEVKVIQVKRNFNLENELMATLKQTGLSMDSFGNFYKGKGIYDTIIHIIENKAILAKKFMILPPEIDGRVIKLYSPKLTTSYELTNDWFDLRGLIIIAGVEYPISRFFKNIKLSDPFFKLDDESFILLPDELMSKYEEIIRFASEDNNDWLLSKIHKNLLQNISLVHEVDCTASTISVEDVIYQQSKKLKASLRPYQVEGVKWLLTHQMNQLGACLADDMGLGKTLQTIAVLLHAKENLVSVLSQGQVPVQLDLFGTHVELMQKGGCSLIILPASLVFNWYNELNHFAPSMHKTIFLGNQREKLKSTLDAFDIVLTTYQTALKEIDFLSTIQFKYIVLDESQYIRNKDSKIFKALHGLNTDHRISLSGTPIENSLTDLWSQMEFINPNLLGTYAFFKEHYQLPIERKKDEKAMIGLRNLIEPYILRRTKQEVAPDLPELIEQVSLIEMSPDQSKAYEKEKSSARNHLMGLDKADRKYRFNVLAAILRLRQIANHPQLADDNYSGQSGKYDDVLQKAINVVKAGHKLIIFSSFVKHLELFEARFNEISIPFVKLTGQSSQEARKGAVYDFQQDESIRIFLISIKAGGTGLNLTAAEYIFILEPWWNPFVEKQAIARAHRIGQQNSVIVTRFVTKDTLEEKIQKLQTVKSQLSDDIIGKKVNNADLDTEVEWSMEEIEGLLK